MKRRLPNGGALASWIILGAATLMFAGALWSALRIAPPPGLEPSPPGAVVALDGLLPPDTQRDSAAAATLASDPFDPERSLPDRVEESVAIDSTPSVPAAAVTLLGTVVRGSSPFALCQLPSDVPRIVHVGEKVGDLTLVSLDQGRATFRARTGARVELSLSRPGS